MDVLEAIHTRRSIRQYKDEPLSAEQIETLLRAAMAAPSAGNAQPWHFLVIEDQATRDRLAAVHPYAKMLSQAAAGILVLGEPSQEKYPGYWPLDCAAAVENLLLAARGMELGAVWTGVWPTQERITEIRSVLDIPESVIPHTLIAVGVPAQESKRVDRFKPERVHHGAW